MMFQILQLMVLFISYALAALNNGCPPGMQSNLGSQKCTSSPCENATCPRYPDAQCLEDNFCGRCTTVFINPNTNTVIPKFSCELGSNYPDCHPLPSPCLVPAINCSFGCPRIPEAVCNLDCNCSYVYTDPRNGNSFSAVECGREYDSRCPPLGAVTICLNKTTTCPRTCPPNHICCPSACVGSSSCIPIKRKTPSTRCRRIKRRNMRYRCDRSNRIGSTCSLTCVRGFRLRGANQTTCTDNGFSPSPRRNRCVRVAQQCKRSSCRNMIVKCIAGNRIGSNCTLSCIPNYRLIGGSFTTCTSKGFSPSIRRSRCAKENPPKCVRPSVPKMRYRCTNANNQGSQCRLTCRGAHTRLAGVRLTTCTQAGFRPDPAQNRCDRRRAFLP